MKNEILMGLEDRAVEAIVVAAADSIAGYGFFDRTAAEEAGFAIIAQNPWMSTEDVRDWMIYKLTGEAP